MDVKQLIKRLEEMDQDKCVLYREVDGGWDNIEIIEEEHNVIITCDNAPLFD